METVQSAGNLSMPNTVEEARILIEQSRADLLNVQQKLAVLKKKKKRQLITTDEYNKQHTPLAKEWNNKAKYLALLKEFVMTSGVGVVQGKVLVATSSSVKIDKSLSKREFVEPKSMSEALSRREELNQKIVEIQAQLTGRTIRASDGRPTGDTEFFKWRNKAHFALAAIRAQSLSLKKWMRERQMLIDGPLELNDVDLTDPWQLLRGAKKIMRNHNIQWENLSEDEQIMYAAIKAFLNK